MDEAAGKRRFRQHLYAAGWLVLGMFGCCGGCAFVLDDRPLTDMRIKQIEQDMDRRLPEGSSWDDARAWFASQGLEPGYIGFEEKRVGLMAMKESYSLFWVRSARIVIEVYFTSDGKLEKRYVRRWGASI